MNNITRIILIVLLFFGLLLWVRTCNKISRNHLIEEVIKDQRLAYAVIHSKDHHAGSKYEYDYNFHVDSVKYFGGTNAGLNKTIGDTIAVYYSSKDPASNYYYNERSVTGYSFSFIDILVGLILVCVFFLTSYLRKMHAKN